MDYVLFPNKACFVFKSTKGLFPFIKDCTVDALLV